MKKIFTLICISFLLATTSIANENTKAEENAPAIVASSLTGKVIDKTSGEELAGVAVKLEGTKHVAFSDFEGNFSFNNINPGNYKLIVEFISYNKVEAENILVRENEIHQLKFGLEQKN